MLLDVAWSLIWFKLHATSSSTVQQGVQTMQHVACNNVGRCCMQKEPWTQLPCLFDLSEWNSREGRAWRPVPGERVARGEAPLAAVSWWTASRAAGEFSAPFIRWVVSCPVHTSLQCTRILANYVLKFFAERFSRHLWKWGGLGWVRRSGNGEEPSSPCPLVFFQSSQIVLFDPSKMAADNSERMKFIRCRQ